MSARENQMWKSARITRCEIGVFKSGHAVVTLRYSDKHGDGGDFGACTRQVAEAIRQGVKIKFHWAGEEEMR